MKRWGASQAAQDGLAQQLTSSQSPSGAVWPDNAPTVTAFLMVCTQWRTALQPTEQGMRMLYIGFDYSAVRVGLKAMQIDITPKLWAGLLVMEQAARAALNGEAST